MVYNSSTIYSGLGGNTFISTTHGVRQYIYILLLVIKIRGYYSLGGLRYSNFTGI